jgi:phthiocerol/phenolphthiocerol synthesis type-I polyketide synthase E
MKQHEETPMSELDSRLAALSPEKRKLVELLQKQRAAAAPAPRPPETPAPTSPRLLDGERFALDSGTLRDQEVIRDFYDTVNRQLDATPFGEHALFLNYGYVPNDGPQYSRVRLPDNYLNKNGTRLVLELLGDCELREEHSVLDVGCGRGGVCAVLRRFFQVGRYAGLDLSPAAIAFSGRTHRDARNTFQVGKADALPFGDESFDMVTNVESSHGYPDIGAFYREVHRVLRPGGCFLYTDILPVEQVEESACLLRELGFEVERELDITGNVLLSCDETAAVHRRAFLQGNDSKVMETFLAEPDSRPYQEMKSGRARYMLYRFRKPGLGARDGRSAG